MRNLTIRRKKSFVGCLGKLKIYIEDRVSGDLTINGVPCRKIGDLKNGEEKTFVIGNEETRVYAIFDKLSKDYCNDYFDIPAGDYDLLLTGQNQYNPASGNAFRFDNNNSEGVEENRKKGTRKGLVVLIVACIVGVIIGIFVGWGIVSDSPAEPETFTKENMSITLTDDFREVQAEGYLAAYDSENVAVLVTKEDFSLLEGFGDYTVEEYAGIVVEVNELKDTQVKKFGDLTYFNYDYYNPDTKTTYEYFSYAYKSQDAFWLIQFATPEEYVSEAEPLIMDWAKSVEFAD
ncbi:MAG: hypothetical protein E7563_00965 [Ruminococcaceae bacterium]|nr:hypothetical protein [Oscillospiraceae bacterium]